MNDELDEMALGNDQQPYGTRTHIFNITDLDNVTYEGFYEGSSPAIDHNLYALDQFIYESNYRSGVRVLDAIRVAESQLNEVAFFDLYPENDNAQFSGTWSNYPYLPSGIVLATSMYDGMFIVKPTIITTSQNSWELCDTQDVVFEIDINANLAFPLTVALEGMEPATATAQTITSQGVVQITLSGIEGVNPGDYTPNLVLASTFGEQYEIPLQVNICPSIGVEDMASNALTVYPNPANDLLRVELKTTIDQLDLVDATGRIVRSLPTFGQRQITMDVKSVANGVYSLKAGANSIQVLIQH
jgi:hypothetical protein